MFVIGAILAGATVQAGAVSALAQFAYPDNRWFGFVHTSTGLSVLVGGITFAVLLRSRAALTYTGEVVGEMLRVTWPSRDESVRAATTVVATSLFVAGLIAVFDFTWKNLADLVLFQNQ
ncbi:MAG: preprotein translocase subunit SecE [Myxococcota bacterium]